ncbi:MAG: DNA translocase FtsK 4TM domain-containing protein [Candidatus Cyclobacteriaceae bacterium M3_2C_046]
MAKNTYKSNTFKKPAKDKKKISFKFNFGFLKDRKFVLASGFFLLVLSLFLLTSFVSYLFTYKADQSVVEAINETGLKASGIETENWLGLFGAISSYYFIFKWFGIAAFFTPPLLFILGFRLVFRKNILPPLSIFKFSFFFTFWISLLMGYLTLDTSHINTWSFLSGGIGFELAFLFDSLVGWGTFLFLLFTLIVFSIYYFDITRLLGFSGINLSKPKIVEEAAKPASDEGKSKEKNVTEPEEESEKEIANWVIKKEDLAKQKNKQASSTGLELAVDDRRSTEPESNVPISNGQQKPVVPDPVPEEEKLELDIHQTEEEEQFSGKLENYDPTLDLGSYKYPPLDLLIEHSSGNIEVSKEELEQNKDKILETLINFKIGISSIKATIGPTVTLYEIVPEAGVKISKIKNLEDDIALNLAALGIRIIAPIPGKGTIGIEVPNKNREMVSVKSVLSTEKFLKSDKELPVVLGKTISNEVFVGDLAKMPHLLMAGATGQGKSVGINVLLASLIYKKHPSQLKFVLVDPKKVELTLYNTIERHFLAKLPDSEEAIITDTKKVIYTLNSLCIEMDRRYDLLKDGGCRNLKEYNQKFINRRLNPEKGHRFLPYIVLVIDELSDLMITAGKEIETPIIRLAQLARAIGIHIVIATQRPSVNVITGIIKANFPARISFRVTSKIDSRTILDIGGAEQLIGMGDMLLSQGSDLIRLQCPFIDTPEVENVCEYVGAQRGYPTAYPLPEYSGDEEGDDVTAVDLSDRDELFDQAARLIVAHQQGSTSLIQRKMKLGYNRAGRLIDQLEAAGVVGPFEGSKAREVLIQDEYTLEQLLNSIDKE